ncbi:MAG: type I DNA topoisomerase [Bacteroidetes bacterium QS_9_68_14]|nr:MAG: type I DNA topoisomerase [Bacteroidetes bacterium QS_9_68_14]
MKRLVVVESPTKADTIRDYLSGDGHTYEVQASMGHVRDLPASAGEVPEQYKDEDWSDLGVNVEEGFEPVYVTKGRGRKVLGELRSALESADELYIATDEDREGESIGWHLTEALDPDVPVRRMVFHEITQDAIQRALDDTRGIDRSLVAAQETRRILDRLVGYRISPLLWRKIAPKLSAGRVQSVAVRILVLREKERIVFVPATYWDLEATLRHDGQTFDAELTHFGAQGEGVRIASGKDFADETGWLEDGVFGWNGEGEPRPNATPPEGLSVPERPSQSEVDAGDLRVLFTEEKVTALAEALPEKAWRVAGVKQRTRTKSPYPPFITSSLQQEASRKLGFSSGRTMSVAQRLYENGHITYMRTDSTNLAQEAVEGARQAVEGRYGEEFLSKSARSYGGQTSESAQEAHEAIRPAGSGMRTQDELGLTGQEGRLYDLIWKRTIATQMADARLRYTNAYLDVEGPGGHTARFRAGGKEVLFPGFFRAYVEGSDDPEAELEDREHPLPALEEGDAPDCRSVEPSDHETEPPSRYTEASLVEILEEEGIGRPSTYASIIETIQQRGYVEKNGKQLVPTFTAFATNNLLEKQFERLVNTGFTAEMEGILDDIARGERDATPFLEGFYRGEGGLDQRVETGLEEIDPKAVSEIRFDKWQPYVVRVGRYGPYVEGPLDATGETATASLPDDLWPSETTKERLHDILEESNAGDRPLGIHPEHDMPVLLKNGPYGPYVQLGDNEQQGKPKRVSLPPRVEPKDVDFDLALQIINLPRTLGEHPDDGQPVDTNVGRYGPYVRHWREDRKPLYASLKQNKGDDVLTVELDRALELLEKKKSGRREPERTLGEHPETGEPVTVWDGRYGPYVRHDGTNASLIDDQTIENVTLEEAVQLVAEKEG